MLILLCQVFYAGCYFFLAIGVLQQEVHASTKQWIENLSVVQKARVSQHFGNIPDIDPNPAASPNGPSWAWWCVAVLPIEPRIQMALLAMNSYKERLEAMKKVLKYLNTRRQ